MRALSIRQPWAWAICYAGKDIENRTWRTDYRGPLLIHASQAMTRDEYRRFHDTLRTVRRANYGGSGVPFPAFEELQRGGIIGRAEIVDCVHRSRAPQSPWFFGPFGFVLTNMRPTSFRPLKGKLGFFEVPE